MMSLMVPIKKDFRDLERWLRGQECLLLFLSLASNSSQSPINVRFRGPNTLSCPAQTTTYMRLSQNQLYTCTHKSKQRQISREMLCGVLQCGITGPFLCFLQMSWHCLANELMQEYQGCSTVYCLPALATQSRDRRMDCVSEHWCVCGGVCPIFSL